MTHNLYPADETAFAFKCQGDDLIGFLHEGDRERDIGVLTLVAGGPQYRGGVGRQLLHLGRHLASEGIPVMRFDHRGLGDSEGSYQGFRHIGDDIAAAIAEFRARAPNVRHIILWGGCDSATAALIHAHKCPAVVAIIAGNPFVGTAAFSAKARRKHYLSRLREKSFWIRLIKGKYSVSEYISALWRPLWRDRPAARVVSRKQASGESDNFIDELFTGLRQFQGRVLFLMGDRFLRSDAFDALVSSTPAWQALYHRAGHERIDIKGGDQVFSTREAQERLFEAASTWLHRTFPPRHVSRESAGNDKGLIAANGSP
ncbi:MAG: hydrolase 1, exosortase A system-associated [Porticoccaceae bacterium]